MVRNINIMFVIKKEKVAHNLLYLRIFWKKSITTELIGRIFKPELAELYTERINSLIEERLKSFNSDKLIIENKIKETEKQIDHLLDAIQAGCDIDVVKPRLNILSHEKESLEAQLGSMELKVYRKKVSVEVIRDVLRNSAKILKECDLENKQNCVVAI